LRFAVDLRLAGLRFFVARFLAGMYITSFVVV